MVVWGAIVFFLPTKAWPYKKSGISGIPKIFTNFGIPPKGYGSLAPGLTLFRLCATVAVW